MNDEDYIIDFEQVVKDLEWHEDTLSAFLYGAECIKSGYGLEMVPDLEQQSVDEEDFMLAEGYKRCLEFMNLCLLVNNIV